MASSGHYGEPITVKQSELLAHYISNAGAMDCEWWGTFLQGIRQGRTIEEACDGANYEWDLYPPPKGK